MEFNSVFKHFWIDYLIYKSSTGELVAAGEMSFSCKILRESNIRQAKLDALKAWNTSEPTHFVKITTLVQLDAR